MTSHLLNEHRLLVTEDLQESQQFLSPIWERHRAVPRGSRFAIRWHQANLHRTSLAYVDHPCSLSASCDGPLGDHFRILLPFSGRIENRINGKRAVLTPSSIVLHAPGQDLKLEIDEFRLLLLSLPGGFVRRALSRRFRKVPPLETWAAEFSRRSAAASSLHSLTQWTAVELDRPDSLFRTEPRAAASLERTLLSLFIEMLAAQYPEDRSRRGDLADGQLALIEAWIEANLDEAFGVEDLAAVANVSARSVQLAFGRLRGCTPMQFVLRRRLKKARSLLISPTPSTTVTTVAMDCGCFHLGRFAAAYRALFGEKPSETLARAARG
jgi:AraC-like DNA-binding protein